MKNVLTSRYKVFDFPEINIDERCRVHSFSQNDINNYYK